MLSNEYHYKILKLVEANPQISQRELSSLLGISLGKVNYCLKALISLGMVKIENFKNSENKMAYAYLLTPSGIEAKAMVAAVFLREKIAEYEMLKTQIAELEKDMESLRSSSKAGN